MNIYDYINYINIYSYIIIYREIKKSVGGTLKVIAISEELLTYPMVM